MKKSALVIALASLMGLTSASALAGATAGMQAQADMHHGVHKETHAGHAAGGASAPMGAGSATAADVSSVIASWPETSRKVAAQMMSKYGQPQGVTPTMLVWENSGPWKRTIVHKEEVPHKFPMPHTDVLQQYIDYQVPPDKFDDLAFYDGSVVAERTNGEMSARCDKEEANFLAINLAHEVATGKRTVAQARQFYADTIKNMMAGKSSPYLQGFVFSVPKGQTADPDVAVLKK